MGKNGFDSNSCENVSVRGDGSRRGGDDNIGVTRAPCGGGPRGGGPCDGGGPRDGGGPHGNPSICGGNTGPCGVDNTCMSCIIL